MILYFDLETFYSQEYTLRTMTPAEYILDRRYETLLGAFAVGNGPSIIVEGPDIPAFLSQFDPAKTDTVAFNATFDSSILAWVYGFVPRRIYCSMSLARTLRGHKLASASLASVSRCLGLRDKGTAITKSLGLHLAQLKADPAVWREFCDYAQLDNDLSREIFQRLIPELPASERRTMDQVLRTTIEPRLMADTDMLAAHLVEVRAEKDALLQRANADASEFSSAPKFAALLESLGVEVEYKTSTKGNKVPCFAKTDGFMEELQSHPDERVRAAAVARLGIRSTIEETRGERMLKVASLPWEEVRKKCVTVSGNMPIPLRIAGAHTLRLSGDWRMNMQNLPRAAEKPTSEKSAADEKPGKSTSKLRASLRAPAGSRVIVADLSQIECRLNAWFCGEENLLELFRTKQDPYGALASQIFGYACNKKDHPVERFIGKSGELGLGFGCGKDKFYGMVWRLSRQLGMVSQIENIWTPELAGKAVQTYRSTHTRIKSMWKLLEDMLSSAWIGEGGARQVWPVEFGEGYVKHVPSGLTMRYMPLQPATDDIGRPEYRYMYGGRTHKIYGAHFLENIIQFMARIVIMDAADRLWTRGLRFCSQTHDELVYVVPEADVSHAKQAIYEELIRSPEWALDLPMDAEIGDGETYGDAK